MARRVLHLIAQAHLDPVWLWPWRDGAGEALTTMQSAIDRLDEVPDLRFSRSSACTYRWAQEQDPRLFEAIRARVAEGRWEAVGGWIEQPDCHLPASESFVRQSLIGKAWFRRHLGCDVTVGYNVDSFGHAAGLPQLLVQAGYRYYVYMRPTAAPDGIPAGLHWWEGPDGSRVLCWHIPHRYGQHPWADAAVVEQELREAADGYFRPDCAHAAVFLGVGNHGGGPTKRMLAAVAALRANDTLPELRFSTLGEFFAAVEGSMDLAALPVIRGSLKPCLRGCQVVSGEVKRQNRRAERALIRGESASVLAAIDRPRAAPALGEAWWSLLLNQFHDILAGTCVASTNDQTRDGFGVATHAGEAAAISAVHTLARRIDTRGAPEGVLVAVNTLPFARTAIITSDTFVSPHRDTPITHLRADDGSTQPLQWLPADALFGPFLAPWGKLSAALALPAGGWRAYHLAHGEAPAVADPAPALAVDPRAPGLLALPACAALAAPIALVVVDDQHDTWGFNLRRYGESATGEQTIAGRPTLESTTVLADGPVARIVRQIARWGGSVIVLDWYSWRGVPGVELRLHVNWQEARQTLLLEVPTALTAPVARAAVAGGVEILAGDGGEEPMQDWIAVEGTLAAGQTTVAVVSESTGGVSVQSGALRLPVARNAAYAEHPPVRYPAGHPGPWTDQGWNQRRFWLLANPGAWTALDLPRLSASLLTPADYLLDSAHPGDQAWQGSLVAVDGPGVAVLALKPAEDGEGIIVRVQELHGRATVARVRIDAWGIAHDLALAPWRIASLRLRRDGRVVAVDLLEQG